MSQENRQIAATILEQLGGRQFIIVTGTKDFLAINRGLTMRLAKNKTTANRLKITLTGEDLYDVEFFYFAMSKGGVTTKTIAKFDGLYFDQLQDTFEEVTGLYTTLNPRKAA